MKEITHHPPRKTTGTPTKHVLQELRHQIPFGDAKKAFGNTDAVEHACSHSHRNK